ncbi:MAG: Na+/H+ antiporter NhaA [Gemmatimonadaceae bacterium]
MNPLLQILRPFQEFFEDQTAGGLLLLACAAVAMIWANSPWAESYHHLWETTIAVGPAGAALSLSLHHWINDGLMVLFFFVVGLEIKRELLIGELASPRQAALPIAAALGGMIAPALLYTTLNVGGPGSHGWGVPMATDIAFALGVLALLGPRVPTGIKVFLAALAIVDDLGAVVVIALFYTAELKTGALLAAAAITAFLFLMNRLGVRRPAAYAIGGIALWLAVLLSGIHATIAGVLLAMTIPARTRIDEREFADKVEHALGDFRSGMSRAGTTVLTDEDQQNAIWTIEEACEGVQAPLLKFEDSLHGIVAFAIMPLFALANAGVTVGGGLAVALAAPITWGVILGLVIGKPIGITAFSWLAVRLGLAELPHGVTWRGIIGTSLLGGIGFTMALFIASLAFSDVAMLDHAKLGILSASTVAGIVGWLVLRTMFGGGGGRPGQETGAS